VGWRSDAGGLRRWPVRPPLGGVRQRESDGGQVLVGGVAVDAIAPCIGLDGDGGAGGDPGPAGLTAGLPAHPVPARRHAGRVRAAWRSRSRLRRQAPAAWRPGSAAGTADDRYLRRWAAPPKCYARLYGSALACRQPCRAGRSVHPAWPVMPVLLRAARKPGGPPSTAMPGSSAIGRKPTAPLALPVIGMETANADALCWARTRS
jgi:hypothetical protein